MERDTAKHSHGAITLMLVHYGNEKGDLRSLSRQVFSISAKAELERALGTKALVAPDKNEDTTKTDTAERNSQDVNVANISRQNPHAIEEEVKLDKEGIPGRLNFTKGANLDNTNITGDVYMEEASVTSDDVVRAGGFGARDDIGSFLPVAIDSTDFEASLRDARDYEEPQEQINRPGLGWTGAMESERR